MVVRCKYMIYEGKIHLRLLAIKVRRVHTASNVSYNRKTGTKRLY